MAQDSTMPKKITSESPATTFILKNVISELPYHSQPSLQKQTPRKIVTPLWKCHWSHDRMIPKGRMRSCDWHLRIFLCHHARHLAPPNLPPLPCGPTKTQPHISQTHDNTIGNALRIQRWSHDHMGLGDPMQTCDHYRSCIYGAHARLLPTKSATTWPPAAGLSHGRMRLEDHMWSCDKHSFLRPWTEGGNKRNCGAWRQTLSHQVTQALGPFVSPFSCSCKILWKWPFSL